MTAKKKMTYAASGVSIQRGEAFVKSIKGLGKKQGAKGVLAGVGGFASLFDPQAAGYQDPIIVSGTDGVGTKLMLAQLLNKFDTIGIDLVAMCVNDILTLGAKPVFFLDYFACAKLENKQALAIVKGIKKGCDQAACHLIGGETAEMPGLYQKGDFDLAGFAVGLVERQEVVDGQKIKAGDMIVGLPSSGCHSNGYSLVRKILERGGVINKGKVGTSEQGLLKQLLKPTTIYVKPVKSILKKIEVKAMSHITGGGIAGNLVRSFPPGLSAKISLNKIATNPLFKKLAKMGNVEQEEMLKVFNMGLGFALVIKEGDYPLLKKLLLPHKLRPFVLGKVVKERKKSRVIFT